MKILDKNQKKILWWSILLYFIVFSGICIWKYFQFGYNGLDLAIFNQVFYNSAQGNFFHFTIHPQSYLGDHFAPIIILLLPFYYFFQHPICLLILQTLILALTAWPIFLISKKLLPSPYILLPVFAWLLNPFVQNINLFEFHLLPFAVFFLFWTFYFYLTKKFGYYILFLILSLLVREDVALVIFMFSIIALIDKRKLSWIVWPALISSSWFILALKITAYFAPDGQYKFLHYYSWLGSSFNNIIINLFSHPLIVLGHVLTLNNILFTLMLFMPFAYLNWLKSRYLLLALIVYAQIILAGSANSTIALKIHYSCLFLPALFITLIFGLKKLLSDKADQKNNFLFKHKQLILIIFVVAIIYSNLTLGPILSATKNIVKPNNQQQNIIQTQMVNSITSKQNVLASYNFLTHISSRENVYGLNYAFIGKKQFSDLEYTIPDDLDIMLVDFTDLLTFGLQFPGSNGWQKNLNNGDNNLRKIIDRGFKITKINDSFAILEKTNEPGNILYETEAYFDDIQHPQNINLDNKIKFLGWSTNDDLPITIYFQATKKLDKNYQLKLIFKDSNKIIHEKLYPLAYGLYPTTEWQTNEIVKINYWFMIPENIQNTNYQLEIQLVDISGYITLNGTRSVVPKITQSIILGEPIELTE